MLSRYHVRLSFIFLTAACALAVFLSIAVATANAAFITSTLDFGDSGTDVLSLQTYLSHDVSVYPEGLVSGYFGALTQAAVQRFQKQQGIVSSGSPETTGYGRVGPRTLARINDLMGGSSSISWDPVPVISPVSVRQVGADIVFMWSTSEPTQGQVYSDTAPLRADEATGPNQAPYASGTLTISGTGLNVNHTVTLTNVARNTTYYYLVRAIDAAGNMSMIWPMSFRTNP